jgi:hypothetical protein
MPQQHFVVTPSGLVLKVKSAYGAEEYAKTVEGSVTATDDPETGLANVPTPLLVVLYNIIRPEKPIQKFADRKSAEKRMIGVLDALSKPAPKPVEEPADDSGEEPASLADDSETPNDAPPSEGDTDMATKSARKRTTTAKKTTAKKATGATRTNAAKEITEATARKVITMREKGASWPEVIKELGETNNFVHRVRPIMKKLDKSSVKPMGPGSPNYGKGATKKKAAK